MGHCGYLYGALSVSDCPWTAVVRAALDTASGTHKDARHSVILDLKACSSRGFSYWTFYFRCFPFSPPPPASSPPPPPPIRPHCRLSDPILHLARDYIDGVTSAGCVLFVTLCVWSGVILQLFNNKINNGYLERLNRTDLKRLHIL